MNESKRWLSNLKESEKGGGALGISQQYNRIHPGWLA
jgi:hypothetical protein